MQKDRGIIKKSVYLLSSINSTGEREMKNFTVISKKNCSKCEDLKAWLKEEGISYEEWSLEEEEVKHKLLGDEKFIQRFCDIDGCMVYTPVIRLEDTGEYYFKELFGISGLRPTFNKKLLEL